MGESKIQTVPPRTELIAEIADNHGGDMNLARHFIKTLAGIGVDVIKFQSWQMKRVRDRNAEPFYDWLKGAELSDEQHRELIDTCGEHKVRFLTTVFDIHRIEFLAGLGLKSVKIPSPDLSNAELLKEARAAFDHLYVSTGMHTAEEVRAAAEVLEGARYTFMHCVSIYPHSPEEANLGRIEWLRQFTPRVGYSDHCGSLDPARMAMVMGVECIERHCAMGRHGPGRVNAWDTFPEHWEELVAWRRTLEQAFAADPERPLTESEEAARRRFIGRWSGGPARRQKADA